MFVAGRQSRRCYRNDAARLPEGSNRCENRRRQRLYRVCLDWNKLAAGAGLPGQARMQFFGGGLCGSRRGQPMVLGCHASRRGRVSAGLKTGCPQPDHQKARRGSADMLGRVPVGPLGLNWRSPGPRFCCFGAMPGCLDRPPTAARSEAGKRPPRECALDHSRWKPARSAGGAFAPMLPRCAAHKGASPVMRDQSDRPGIRADPNLQLEGSGARCAVLILTFRGLLDGGCLWETENMCSCANEKSRRAGSRPDTRFSTP